MRHQKRMLSRLKNVSLNGKGYRACCPAHDDTNPSLDIVMDGDNFIRLRCLSANCKLAAIYIEANRARRG